MNSYWIDSVELESFSSLDKDIDVDVCIVGGGITGISTAYLLSKAGLSVCILEKDKIAQKTTGNTTAKITSQHGLFYDYLNNTFSTKFAKGYLDANEEAINNIEQIVQNENINCDFKRVDSYIYTTDEEEVIKIKQEVEAVNLLDFPAKFVDTSSLPFSILAGIFFPNQAQFHPLKYVNGLVKSISKQDVKIFENTKVYDVKKSDNHYLVITKNHNVKAKYVVLACHYPIINAPGFYFLKMYQETSYIIGFTTSSPLFDGMHINTKCPIASFRTTPYQDTKLVLLGGSDHKTGIKNDISKAYESLEEYAKSLYPDANILYRWSTEDCIPLDKIPYIGPFSNLMPNVYVATGFKKWGMTTSNIAANIITNYITKKDNPYKDIFLSTRFHPIQNGTEFVNMLKQTSQSLIIDKFKVPQETLDAIKKDEGKIIEIENTKIGIYRDENGKYFAIKPVCSHLGCELSFNENEKTWDCPCHGSRFSYTGKSIYAPSIDDIPLLNIDSL